MRAFCRIAPAAFFALLIAAHLTVTFTLAGYMRRKPFVEKLGYIPSVSVMKVMAADHRQFVAASLIVKTLVYFGSLMDKADNEFQIPADYPAMSRSIDASLKLDPYNMDGYYFAQAILAWDVKKADLAITFLEYGMKYRTWDWHLPYFAAFNYSYFLKDYVKAAPLYQRAAELSGNDMFMNLAARYMYESGRTEMAVAYLDSMAKSARQESIRNTLTARRDALIAVLRIERAVERYQASTGSLPVSLIDLVQSGFIDAIPVDPYGGRFFLDKGGKVSTTSRFSFHTPKK